MLPDQTVQNLLPTVDLEYLLQSECRTLRVVERLHGGSHLLIPKVGGNGSTSSLALRVYHECDAPIQNTVPASTTRNNPFQTEAQDDTEYLANFFKSFKLTVVFFLLPSPDVQMMQLSNPNSFFQRAQTLAHPRLGPPKLHTSTTQPVRGPQSRIHFPRDRAVPY